MEQEQSSAIPKLPRNDSHHWKKTTTTSSSTDKEYIILCFVLSVLFSSDGYYVFCWSSLYIYWNIGMPPTYYGVCVCVCVVFPTSNKTSCVQTHIHRWRTSNERISEKQNTPCTLTIYTKINGKSYNSVFIYEAHFLSLSLAHSCPFCA